MSNVVIRVEKLAKQYQIGQLHQRNRTLRDAVVAALKRVRRRPQSAVVKSNTRETFWALRDVSFEVTQGEVVGIVGSNGAGKSTLLKILTRITEPTSGQAELHGRIGALLEVGTGFHPELTGRENIFFSGALLGMHREEIDLRFDEIVDFSGVARFIDTPVKRYSSGMKVRLGFAVAAHLDTEILLVDEVLAVGDAAFQRKCLGKMNDVSQDGRTVFLVSHNMAAIKRLCSRALLFNEGKLAADGSSPAVISTYLQSLEYSAGIVHPDIDLDNAVSIKELGITDGKGAVMTNIPADEDFYIWTRLLVRKRVEKSQIALAVLSDFDSTVVFVSTHADSLTEQMTHLDAGEYRAKVRVPGRFLNIGSYSVNLRVWGSIEGETRESHADAYNALTFRIEETGSIASKLMDGRRGYVTPLLDWQVES